MFRIKIMSCCIRRELREGSLRWCSKFSYEMEGQYPDKEWLSNQMRNLCWIRSIRNVWVSTAPVQIIFVPPHGTYGTACVHMARTRNARHVHMARTRNARHVHMARTRNARHVHMARTRNARHVHMARMYRSLQEYRVMRLTTVNGQNRAAFVDNKRNMRKCNCHASVALIGSILSLVIILRITTKSQSSKNKSSARLRAPRLSEHMTAADRAVVALRTLRHNRSK